MASTTDHQDNGQPGGKDQHHGHDTHDGERHHHHGDHGGGDHGGHDKHEGHDPEMFRRLFWWNLVLAVPVLVFSPQIQEWFGYTIDLPGSAWVAPVLGTVIYLWGGRPFLKGGLQEIRDRQPAMMLLIALAITVAYLASLASSLGWADLDFWWELAALIVVMLLGHWQEMKAIGQAQGALEALAELLPDTAERVVGDGDGGGDSGGGADQGTEEVLIIDVEIGDASSDPRSVIGIIDLSEASYAKMVQNLAWATGYNLLALPVAAGVFAFAGLTIPPAAAAVAMSLSTIIVAANAQLLRRLDLRPTDRR